MTLSSIKYSGETFEDGEKYIVTAVFTGKKIITGTYIPTFMDDTFVPDDKYLGDFAYLEDFEDFPHPLRVRLPNSTDNLSDYITSSEIATKIEEEKQKCIDSEVNSNGSYSSPGVPCTITISSFSSFYGSDTTGECFIEITNITDK